MDVAELAFELVALDSTTGAEGPVGQYLAERLRRAGFDVTLQEVTPGRWNVYARAGAPVVVLTTHLDTVPPYVPPRRAGDRLYGRGSCDAKGIAAAMVCAVERLRAAGAEGVALLFLVGEEAGSDGARAAARLEPKGRVLVGGEPTGLRLARASRGSFRVVVRTRGRAGHSATAGASREASAVERLVDLLAALRTLPLPSDPEWGATTYNVGRIGGGRAANVVAEEAWAEILFRTVEPARPRLWPALKAWADGRATLEPGLEVPPARFDVEPGFAATVVPFATDLPLLEGWGRRYLVGPGDIEVAHAPDEHVDVTELRAAVDLYERLAVRLLARERDGSP